MKCRSGFVSNSSSSSFIAVGFFGKDAKFPKWYIDRYKGNNERDLSYEENEIYKNFFPNAVDTTVLSDEEIDNLMDNLHDDLCIGGEEDLWGVNISRWSDEGGITSLDWSDTEKTRNEVIELCKKYGIEVDPKNIKLYAGTIYC